MGSIIGAMGCSNSVSDRKSERVIRAAILIQNWYRLTVARLEMKRRYSLSIFQSIEYAEEQDQLQLSNFFTFMLDHCTHPESVSHIFTSPSVSQVVGESLSLIEFEKKINVPDSYYGPRLSFPLTIKDANALLHAFRNEQLLHARYVLQLLSETRRVLKEMPNITHLSTSYTKEITVCGDLHGNLDDLLLIFYKNGLPSEQNRYVFNGDFVDRGQNSMEILIILFAFLLIYPNDLHLNRGNHEDYIMNLRYGFTKEVSKKYKDHGKQILGLLQDVFSWLPLATIIDSKVLILHGGISDSTDLDFLNKLERNKLKSLMRPPKSVRDGQDQAKERIPTTSKHIANQNVAGKTQHITSSGSTEPSGSNLPPEPTPKEWKQILDILWSDPRSQNGCTPNKCRGGGCYFGPDVTAKLFKKYNLKMLIRSHEFKPEGYEISHGGKVITIFSASNYYEEGSNRGAYIKLNPELIPRFVQYRVSKYTRRQNLRERVGTIESSALKSLRETIYAHRAELTSAFVKYDLNGTGKISVNDWAAAMESVLQLELPWRMLRSQLAQMNSDGEVDFMSCFYDLKIGQPVKEVQPALAETLCRYRKDLEIIFNIIDKDRSGLISLEEFRQTWKLFASHLGIDVHDEALDKLVLSIDYNKDGHIDFNEFLEAFHVVQRLEKKANS
uniref:Serine/threonine-protein phosphatase with EF-hands n=1 Tax=Calidris pygmaea TaxID=425635 RepID=A0A8C3JE58_9CHAR